ncbi:histidine kinase [Actinomadura sp. WMMA1423]|uniref:histidine kinase n=1 Tax=Actinomadura sp. WMMA1423 TaxID=2591108 RepID=UPI0011473CF2|nr:histidine kinase dimerization/phosphoacceptor domain-containing protein [Actinomadura sp. WMMA1423]
MTYPSPAPGRAYGSGDVAGRAPPAPEAAEALARQLSSDAQRIARDLADQITRRLFGIGLELNGALARIQDPCAGQGVQAALTALDDTIADLRRAVFDLRTASRPPEAPDR